MLRFNLTFMVVQTGPHLPLSWSSELHDCEHAFVDTLKVNVLLNNFFAIPNYILENGQEEQDIDY